MTVTVLADGDLTSGGDTIGISFLTWTVGGAGFVGCNRLGRFTRQGIAAPGEVPSAPLDASLGRALRVQSA